MVSLVVVAGLVFVLGATAMQGGVRKLRMTTPVLAGDVASLTVDVVPRARCSIALSDGSYATSSRRLLAPKPGGRITWRWRVPAAARAGLARAQVRCGASGTLRTTFRIVKPITLAAARTAVCARVPERVRAKYRTELVPLLERTLEQLRLEHGTFDCAWGSNYYPGGVPISYYLVTVAAAKAPCTFDVSARIVWPSDPPLPGYTGPITEKYQETCNSLGS
jgi:hypothetical protein